MGRLCWLELWRRVNETRSSLLICNRAAVGWLCNSNTTDASTLWSFPYWVSGSCQECRWVCIVIKLSHTIAQEDKLSPHTSQVHNTYFLTMHCIACQCANTIKVLHWFHCCCHYSLLASIKVWNCASQETCKYYEWRLITPKNRVHTWSPLQICIYKRAIHILERCKNDTCGCAGVKLGAWWWSGGCGWRLCNMRVEFQSVILWFSIKKSRFPRTHFGGFFDFILYKTFSTHEFMAMAIHWENSMLDLCHDSVRMNFRVLGCCGGAWQRCYVSVWNQIFECRFQKMHASSLWLLMFSGNSIRV
jgi:hypothetical protein